MRESESEKKYISKPKNYVLSVPSIGPVEELGNAAKKAKWWQPLLYFEPIGDGPNWKAKWAIIGPQAYFDLLMVNLII